MDIDQLHAVIEGKVKGRQTGQTWADLVLLAQSVDFVPNGTLGFVYAMESGNPYVLFRSVLESLDLYDQVETFMKDIVKFKNGCRVLFIAVNRVRYGLIGKQFDNIFVDHFAEKKLKYDDLVDIAVRLKFPEPRC